MIVKLAVAAGCVISSLLAVPLLLAGGGGSSVSIAAGVCVYGAPDPARTAATIRQLETGANYQTVQGDRSGAYLMTDLEWVAAATRDGINTGTYPNPTAATNQLQDQVAGNRILELLQQYDGSLTAVAVYWHHHQIPADDDPAWITPDATGETLTAWLTRWLAAYATDPYVLNAATAAGSQTCGPGYSLATPVTAPPDNGTPADNGTPGLPAAPPGPPAAALVGGYAFPLPHTAVGPRDLTNPHANYPAIDLIVPTGTPIYAATAGQVVATYNFAQNWFTANCTGQDINGCKTCGTGVTIADSNGARWTYCHMSRRYIAAAATVTAGQNLGLSGDTGRSGTPHLHIEVHTGDTKHCPQLWLQAVWAGQSPPAVSSLPTTGCYY